MNMTTTKFPAKEGWIRMDGTLTKATPLSEDEIKNLVSMNKVDDYEWGKVEQHGKKLKVIMRHKSKNSSLNIYEH